MKRSVPVLVWVIILAGIASAGERSDAAEEFAELRKEAAALFRNPRAKPEAVLALLVKLDRFAEVHRNSPQAPQALYQRAMLGMGHLSHDDRIETFTVIVENYPASPLCEGSYFALGRLLLGQGRSEEARKAFANLLRRYPSTRMRKTVLGFVRQIDLIGRRPGPVQAEDLAGGTVSIPAEGRTTVVTFWAERCKASVAQHKYIRDVSRKFKKHPLAVFSICICGDARALQRSRNNAEGAALHILATKGWNNRLTKTFRIVSVPATFVLDRNGVVRHIGTNGHSLDAAIKKLVASGKKKSPDSEPGNN